MARFGNANAHRITARLVLVGALVALVLRPGAPAGAAAQATLGSPSVPPAFSAPHATPGQVAPLEPLPRPTNDGRVPDAPTAAGLHAANGSSAAAVPTTTTATATAATTATSTATTTASPTPTAKKTTSPTWAPKSSSNLGTAQGALFNTSCSAPGQCTAVGRYVDTAGVIQPLAERLSASTWKIDTMPAPAGSIGVFLTDVSCPAAKFCVAVGQYFLATGNGVNLTEVWNGTSWKVVGTPHEADSIYDGFYGVSCTSSTACIAVGYSAALTSIRAQAQKWNGSTWTIQDLSAIAGLDSPILTDVSCSAATACIAVGRWYDPSTSSTLPLALRWDGTVWTAQDVPVAGGVASEFDSVSCSTASACTAVGYTFDATSGVTSPLAGRWDGTAWSIQTTPANPSGPFDSQLYGVSCSSASACTATGYYRPDPSTFLTLAERWDGTAWTIQTTPNPSGTVAGTAYGVACPSATACTSTGYYYSGFLTTKAFAETWNGSAWTVQTTPNQVGVVGSKLNAVSCTSARSCTAVGLTQLVAGGATLAEHFNGNTWSIQVTESDPQGFGSSLLGVSCTSTSCMAVGYLFGSADQSILLPMIEAWNGTAWSFQKVPTPADFVTGEFDDVSCTAPNACTAVGNYVDSTGTEFALAARWNGNNWELQTVPQAGTIDNAFSGVSCTSATACVAVGSFVGTDPSLNAQTLIETWDGTSWTIQSSVNPAGSADILEAVSCTSSSFCVAVGENYDLSDAKSNLVEMWNGSMWSAPSTPVPAGTGELDSVSCSAASSCIAVGWYVDNATHRVSTTASVWNGATWALETPFNGSGLENVLSGVSCLSTVCNAVGGYLSPSGIPVTLAEQRS